MLTFIDFFAGIGGFRRGMELAGHKCIGFCEFDKFAVASYTAMHLMTDDDRERLAALPKNKRAAEAGKEGYRHGEWYANDVRRVFAGCKQSDCDIPKADCWCFGFPCQDLSVAGKQAGLNGNRSSLFFRIMQLVGELEEEDRPAYLFIENVRNLLSVSRGYDFLAVLIALDENGYDAEWQVINSAGYVPQNRERIFVVGRLRGRRTREVFPIEGTDGENTILQVGNYMPTKKRENPNQGRIYGHDGIAPCLNQMGGGGREPYIAIPVLSTDRVKKRQNGRRFKEDSEPMYTLTTKDRHGVMIEAESLFADGLYLDASQRFNRGTLEGVSRSLKAEKHDAGVLVGLPDGGCAYAAWCEKYGCYVAIRKLTPKECFRLQGWEDVYFARAALVNSDSQLYKQAGNGVTVPVIRAIAERMGVE